jgi:beta-N-acetylhexosaminidase
MEWPTSAQVRRRRLAAIVAAAAITVGIWALLFRDGGEGGPGGGSGAAGSVPEPVRELVASMSPEQKVDGVLLLGFEGTDAGAPIVERLGDRQLGGVLVGSRNWVDTSQLVSLVAELAVAGRSGGRIPPLIVTSQEGGPYRAFPDFPPGERQLDIGDRGDPRVAESSARFAGGFLRRAGFDLNLSPVADVATLDSPIADRAYSDDPAVAASMTAAAIRGCRAAGIACAPKHFPGLGGASDDTAQGPATVSLDAVSLRQRDLVAFEAAFSEGAPAVVLSHAFYAAYDPVTPGSLSSLVASDLLREELGFEGVAITDDLGAGAIQARGAAGETGGGGPRGGSAVTAAAIAALQAGADMLLISSPEDQAGMSEELLDALRSGLLSEDRLDVAVGRVLELKRSLGMLPD